MGIPWSDDIERALRALRRDRRSGATEMARRAAEILRATGADDGKGLPAWQRRVHAVGLAVVDAQPAMASLLTLVDAVFRAAERARTVTRGTVAVGGVVARYGDRLTGAPARAAARVPAVLPWGARVVTLSSSEMVWRALLAARRRRRLAAVVVAESLPGGEGRTTARRLAGEGIAVTLVPDALAPGAVAGADAVVVGADAVTPAQVWNKCGTLGLALAARAARRPLVVVTGTDRLVGATLASRLANVPVAWGRGSGVETDAVLFEAVPLALASRIVTERGLLEPEAVAGQLANADVATWWSRPPGHD